MSDGYDSDARIVRSARLPRGEVLVIREAAADDADALLALFERLSPEDRQRRFFSMFRPDRAFVEHMIDLPDRAGLLLVAEIRDGAVTDPNRLVAEAGYAMLEDGDATFEITVDRGARGWLSPYLLDALVEQAAVHGIPNLRAEVLLGNRPMLALLRARGCATIDSDDHTVIETTIGTCQPAPGWPTVHDRPRVLVEVPGSRWRVTPELRADGIDVIACGGPRTRRLGPGCPMLDGGRCPLVDDADVVVFSLRHEDDDAQALLDAHRRAGTRPLVIEVRHGDRAFDPPADATVLDAPSIDEIRQVIERILGTSPPGDEPELALMPSSDS